MRNLVIILSLIFVYPLIIYANQVDFRFGFNEVMQSDITIEEYVAALEFEGYVNRWEVRDGRNGERVVINVQHNKVEDFNDSIVKYTIGLGVSGVPEHSPSSAILRVGEKIYHYSMRSQSDVYSYLNYAKDSWGMTEVVFFVSGDVISEIQTFIEKRINGEIKYKFGKKKGETIRPDFNYVTNTLTKASCAANCSSFANKDWQKHYERGDFLLTITEALGIQTTSVAKRFIINNYKNPMVDLVVIHFSTLTDFVKENDFGFFRGFGEDGFIPDAAPSKKRDYCGRRLFDISEERAREIKRTFLERNTKRVR